MPTVLIVEDSRIDQHLVGALLAQTPSLTIEFAGDGAEALERIRSRTPDLVVTDLVMPTMSGLELLLRIGMEFPTLPVVVMTGKGSEEIAAEALKSGASGYVPKTTLSRFLPQVVCRLLDLAEEKRDQSRLLQSIQQTETTFVLKDNDTALIRTLIEYVNGCVRDMGICRPGGEELLCLALEEAVRNAIHHGNLEMGPELRECDNDEAFHDLVAKRRQMPKYRDRKVTVTVRLSPEQALFRVRDDGPGFDPASLPDPTSPARLHMICGRGILLMRSIMDEVIYNEQGNEVTLIMRPRPAVLQDSA